MTALLEKLHALPDILSILAANIFGMAITAVLWLGNVDTSIKIVVAIVDLTVATVSVVWLIEKVGNNKIDRKLKLVELEKAQRDLKSMQDDVQNG